MRVAWSVDMSLTKEERVQEMQVILNESDLESAPVAVQEWIMSTLKKGSVSVEAPASTGVPKNVNKAKKEKAVDATTKEAVKETKPAEEEVDPFGDSAPAKAVTHEDVRAAGMHFVKTVPDGKNKLLAALAKVGAPNIKECPQDKLADLLTLLTVS